MFVGPSGAFAPGVPGERLRRQRLRPEKLLGCERRYREGFATFELPTANAFYRAASKPVRDLGVLAALVWSEAIGERLRIADLLAGPSAVRALRYATETNARAVLVNDAISGPGRTVLERNTTGVSEDTVWIRRHDNLFDLAQSEEWIHSFDLIDLDAFGTGADEVASGVLNMLRCRRMKTAWSGNDDSAAEKDATAGALLYCCSTASVTAAGLNPGKAQKTYGAALVRHAAVHEQGLRLLITVVRKHAQQSGFIAQPLFSYFHRAGGTFRVMFRILQPRHDELALASTAAADTGLLHLCQQCGQLWCVTSTIKDAVASSVCPGCGNDAAAPQVRTSGPFYMGPLHDGDFVERMLAVSREAPAGHFDRAAIAALKLMIHETRLNAHPFYYRVGDLARRARRSPPPISKLIERLQWYERTYRETRRMPEAVVRAQWQAARASVDPQGVRTGLPIPAILSAVAEASAFRQQQQQQQQRSRALL
jgi:tRNA (guanine26-N2/guanine27-N2)-dimethyltransferase